jgi:Derlin-2/3
MGSNWRALITFFIHFYSKLYPNAMASLFGLIQTNIVYLPYAVAAMDLLIDGPYGAAVAVSGLIVSQALYMLEWGSASGESAPKRNSWLAAPTWFKKLFRNEIANPDALANARRVYGQASAPAGRGFGDSGRGANTATTSGYSWGEGHRLGDS